MNELNLTEHLIAFTDNILTRSFRFNLTVYIMHTELELSIQQVRLYLGRSSQVYKNQPALVRTVHTDLLGMVTSEGSYLNRSYITDITIIFISEKEFFIFIVFYPPKSQFLFLINFNYWMLTSPNVRVSFRQAPQENRQRASLILEVKFKIEQKMKLSFRG